MATNWHHRRDPGHISSRPLLDPRPLIFLLLSLDNRHGHFRRAEYIHRPTKLRHHILWRQVPRTRVGLARVQQVHRGRRRDPLRRYHSNLPDLGSSGRLFKQIVRIVPPPLPTPNMKQTNYHLYQTLTISQKTASPKSAAASPFKPPS